MSGMTAPSPSPSARRRASLVASPTPQSPAPNASGIPRPQSAAGRYRSSLIAPGFSNQSSSNSVPTTTVSSTDASSSDHDSDKGQVRVVLRIRPSEPEDPSIPSRHRQVLCHPINHTEVRVSVDPATLAGTNSLGAGSNSKRHPTFTFDRVLGESASQVDLYNVTGRERVEEFLKGFNVTFLAYGQTSSGKSYSMGTTGEDADYLDLSESSRAGLIPRTVETIFRRAEEIKQASGPGASWECRVSFLELYNEDLIDLLANTNAVTNVSIRENHDGRIVWSGVREVKVQNVAEVMTLLHDGSNRRRTGETNMNATSSRSHAIFSLTLVQSRRAEVTEEHRAATPSKRPMSVMGLGGPGSRSTTPQFSRPPPSSYGKLAGRPNSMHFGNANQDEMVVITSKFNMVDLAGSERLKRTGAQAERMKEGISINSGLLALGNVISALAEPAKPRGHVPYRDSKLTRLLQDSIGGNAMTTMIACISPLEYNISETINTINYASRARKIKNSVSKNQSEVGWDDIDYLRSQVTKLRAKIAAADTEPRAASKKVEAPVDDEILQRQIIELTDKLADMEDDFSHLQDQYFQKCREIVALSDPDLLEDDKLRQFNETIEPVVLEYEKVVTSLNGQIAELRAEAAVALQAHEDQAAELQKTHDRLTEHESYVQELQGRIAKLTQRNDSSEAYIRDLETKFRNFTDSDERQTEVIAGLQQEIQQLKSESAKSNTYISELEQRIAAADSRNADLAAAVERYETEAETRDKQVQELENRLAMLDNQPNVTLLLEEIGSRDRKIEDLENRIQQQQEARELPVTEAKPQAPSTPPDTPPVLRTIVEDADSEVDKLRKENQVLLERLHEAEMRFEQIQSTPEQVPATPALDPPSEQDEELEDEQDDELNGSPNKRGSTGESSESDTTLETPRLSSRTVSPQINDDPLVHAMSRSPYGSFRIPTRGVTEPRLLRPLSLSQSLSTVSYTGSPRYSWSAPGNGMHAYERSSPRFDRSPKRQSMPFDSKPVRSVQSLEIDISLLQKAVADRDSQLRQREIEIKYLKKTLENNNTPSTQINSEEVIERLRKDHSDQLNKILDEHQRGMNALANEHHSSVGALRHQLEQTKLVHADELEQLKEDHKMTLDELDRRHAKEVENSHDLKSALDAAWEELSATSRRHQEERENLISAHHNQIADLEQHHATVLAALQTELNNATAQLESLRSELVVVTEAKDKAEKELAERPDLKDTIPLEEHNIVVSAMEEMEKALTSAEDEKRQLKMKADQVRFELSKIRDEHDLETTTNLSKIAELEKRCTSLTADNAELKQAVETRNRDSKTDRSSRAKLPPIGPPPTAPLPPLPAGREAVLSPTPTTSSQHRGEESPRSSQHGSHDGHSPRPDSTAESERLAELEAKLAAKEKEHAQFEKDLMEYRKNNSKLKVRVDDANRELAELKRERDALRRDVVEMKNELADAEYERIADRQRLEAARLEAAQNRAKLERALDNKVSKRSDQKLKCF